MALDPDTGAEIWRCPGDHVGYGSLQVAKHGGKRQIVGHDATTLGGWEIANGRRLWTLRPEIPGDFNVPTPLALNGKLLITTENNATRLYDFDTTGKIRPKPVAVQSRLRPDMSSPVAVGRRLFCVHRFLYCLDLDHGLNELSRLRDESLGDYAAILADKQRLLVVGKGELLLLDAAQPEKVISRRRVFEEHAELYSHPALVGDRLFLRGESTLKCLEW